MGNYHDVSTGMMTNKELREALATVFADHHTVYDMVITNLTHKKALESDDASA